MKNGKRVKPGELPRYILVKPVCLISVALLLATFPASRKIQTPVSTFISPRQTILSHNFIMFQLCFSFVFPLRTITHSPAFSEQGLQNCADQFIDGNIRNAPTFVIYRPAMDNEPAHAIGFLLPHSFENLNMLSNSYAFLSPTTAYWAFVSRIDLIEERSGISFPGISDEIKPQRCIKKMEKTSPKAMNVFLQHWGKAACTDMLAQ